jgi:hypothetical protein
MQRLLSQRVFHLQSSVRGADIRRQALVAIKPAQAGELL